jgi:hypothetical protein
MRRILIALLILLAPVLSCEDGTYECASNANNRVGAICNDGTRSNSTGSGTCSGHGGVRTWLCK